MRQIAIVSAQEFSGRDAIGVWALSLSPEFSTRRVIGHALEEKRRGRGVVIDVEAIGPGVAKIAPRWDWMVKSRRGI